MDAQVVGGVEEWLPNDVAKVNRNLPRPQPPLSLG